MWPFTKKPEKPAEDSVILRLTEEDTLRVAEWLDEIGAKSGSDAHHTASVRMWQFIESKLRGALTEDQLQRKDSMKLVTDVRHAYHVYVKLKAKP